MTAIAVMGLQWGDEGKGRVVDWLAGRADTVVRVNGGANAGHTVPLEDGRVGKVHQVPSGAFRHGVGLALGPGVVIDPVKLIREIEEIEAMGGSPVVPRLYIDSAAHVIMPIHVDEDRASEEAAGAESIGTTRTGNGPAYADKSRRVGIRMDDLRGDASDLTSKIERAMRDRRGDVRDQLAWAGHAIFALAEAGVLERVCDVSTVLAVKRDTGRNLLFEIAHGYELDIDHGAYPYVTSSSCGIGAVYSGGGFDPRSIGHVVGVMKPYSTRIGAGPFTAPFAPLEERNIREVGGEYGTTTGRPRRIGVLDLGRVRRACEVNGVDSIAITHMDIAESLGHVPFADCTGRFTSCHWSELTQRIESWTGIPVQFISNGPQRSTMREPMGELGDGVWTRLKRREARQRI
jgi:adenylosuccinate synthase